MLSYFVISSLSCWIDFYNNSFSSSFELSWSSVVFNCFYSFASRDSFSNLFWLTKSLSCCCALSRSPLRSEHSFSDWVFRSSSWVVRLLVFEVNSIISAYFDSDSFWYFSVSLFDFSISVYLAYMSFIRFLLSYFEVYNYCFKSFS